MSKYNEYLTPELKLDDTYEVKILVAYFLWQLARPITRSQLDEIVTADGRVNYFLYSEAVEQMLAGGMILKTQLEDGEYYILSEKAKNGANDFKRLVPKSFRDRILASGLRYFAKLKNDNDVKVTVEKNSRGYTVSCLCTEGELVLMDMKLFAPDEEQAQMLRDQINLNPTEFYASVIDYAIDNKEYNPEPEEVSDP